MALQYPLYAQLNPGKVRRRGRSSDSRLTGYVSGPAIAKGSASGRLVQQRCEPSRERAKRGGKDGDMKTSETRRSLERPRLGIQSSRRSNRKLCIDRMSCKGVS